MREQQLAKQRVAILRNDHILAFGEVFEISLTFWDSLKSFSICFAILPTLCHTYCCTWPTVTKALATPTNSNAHVSPVGSKVIGCARGIHCEYIHLVWELGLLLPIEHFGTLPWGRGLTSIPSVCMLHASNKQVVDWALSDVLSKPHYRTHMLNTFHFAHKCWFITMCATLYKSTH